METTRSATTPKPPYYAVIFTSMRTKPDPEYSTVANRMVELATTMKGYLGMESFRNELGFGVTISYWETQEDIKIWKQQFEHKEAQAKGRASWYSHYKLRVCKVEYDYEFNL